MSGIFFGQSGRSDAVVCFCVLQRGCGAGALIPEESAVLHAAGEPWEPVQRPPGERRAQPHSECGLRERTQPAHPAGPRLRGRHWPQQRGRGTPSSVATHRRDVTETRKSNNYEE